MPLIVGVFIGVAVVVVVGVFLLIRNDPSF